MRRFVLSDTEIGELFAARKKTNETQRVLETLQRETFREQPLFNTGSAAWRTLWIAAGEVLNNRCIS